MLTLPVIPVKAGVTMDLCWLRKGMNMRLAPGTGNHKGCPYEGFVVVYFQRNPPCSLVVCTPRNENAVGARGGQPQGLPLRGVCRGLFSEESFMQPCRMHTEE